MRLFINLSSDGTALFEELPSENGFEIKLGQEDMATLSSLAQIQSYLVAKAIGALVVHAVQEQSRRPLTKG